MFVFKTIDGETLFFSTLQLANEQLIRFAGTRDLMIHLHPSNKLAGNWVSTAFPRGGDELLNMQASVRAAKFPDCGTFIA